MLVLEQFCNEHNQAFLFARWRPSELPVHGGRFCRGDATLAGALRVLILLTA